MSLGAPVRIVRSIVTANCVPWYGIGVFLGLAIALEYLVPRAPDIFTKSAAGTLVTLSLLICLGNRFWQFEMQRNMFEYPMGKVSAEVLEERTIAHYDDVADVVTSRHDTMPDRPYVYRVGTFI